MPNADKGKGTACVTVDITVEGEEAAVKFASELCDSMRKPLTEALGQAMRIVLDHRDRAPLLPLDFVSVLVDEVGEIEEILSDEAASELGAVWRARLCFLAGIALVAVQHYDKEIGGLQWASPAKLQ